MDVHNTHEELTWCGKRQVTHTPDEVLGYCSPNNLPYAQVTTEDLPLPSSLALNVELNVLH